MLCIYIYKYILNLRPCVEFANIRESGLLRANYLESGTYFINRSNT